MKIKIIFILALIALILDSCKKSTDQLFDEAYAFTKKEQYDKAIKIYTELIHRNNKLQLAYYNRGYCYYSKKEYEKALINFNRLISLKAPGAGNFIITLNKEGPFADEEAQYQVSYYDALYQRAQVYFYLEQYKESFEDFNKLTQSNYEEKSNCYLWQGTILLNNGDTLKSCNYFMNANNFANRQDVKKEAGEMIARYCDKKESAEK